jgi:hypothetical protein
MWRVRSFFRGLYNFWYFRKEIWNFRDWDYTYQLRLLKRSLIPLRDSLKDGYEEEFSRMKKVFAINEAMYIIDCILEDPYLDDAEAQLGIDFMDTTDANEAKKVVDLSHELANRDWKRLWEIFEGQNYNEYIMLLDRYNVQSQFEDGHTDVWAKWFNGTDMRGWWN